MSMVDRVKNILTSPKTEWPIIGAEPATTGGLLTYAAILSGIAQLAALIGGILALSLMASAMPGMAAMSTAGLVVQSVLYWVLGLVILFVMSIIAGALAPSFNGRNDGLQALKLLVYAGTAVWVAGFLGFIPLLNIIIGIAGLVYAIYLMYLGATSTVGVPAAKAGGYVAVVVIIWLVLYLVVYFIVSMIVALVVGGAMVASGAGMSTY